MLGLISRVCKYCGGRQLLRVPHRLRPRCQLQSARHLVSTSGKWEPEFNERVRQDIEKHWKDKLKARDLQFQFKEDGGDKRYVLSMFPYPSGALHMGHVRVYTISDAMARFYRLQGYNVLHPMGWDAFGLPAENAAIDHGEEPRRWTTKNIQNMKRQLDQLSLSFDWDREYSTCDPAYYRWTQHIFLKMYEAGLVYQKEAAVNWDPVDQTVLADEQIDEEGRSWRSGAVTEKQLLRQWYIRTSAFSKSLVDGLDEVDSSLWRDVVDLQKHWIGECDGVRLQLKLKCDGETCTDELSVFTRTPELVYGASHVLIAPHHPLNRPPYVSQHSQATDCRLMVDAVHPFTGRHLPVYLDTAYNFGDHLDSHLGIPSSKQAEGVGDAAFAHKHDLDFVSVLEKPEVGTDEVLVNSEQFSGLGQKEAFQLVADYAKTLKCGGHVTSEQARDWLISRQRYWGTPIPVIHCGACGAVPVPYEDLPVTLPDLDQLTGKGLAPLSQAADWLTTTCPRCGSEAQRETDTMDTFVDSSWYFLRYLDPNNTSEPFSRVKARALMPVDLYIGGKEHAIMHLYYARFFSHFLYDCGLLPVREPFVNLLTQGMVMGQSYRLNTGQYVPPKDVEANNGGCPVQRGTGKELTVTWEKMSKSKYNGVDPQDILDKYGTDSTRLCILAGVAPKTERHWDSHDLVGVVRWQARMWTLVTMLHAQRQPEVTSAIAPDKECQEWDAIIFDARNDAIQEVTWNVSKSFLINTAISRLHSFTKTLKKVPPEVIRVSKQYERAVADLIIMIAPFAPMYAAEMWQGICTAATSKHFELDQDVLCQKWPEVDSDYHMKLKVKRSHKSCFEIKLPVSIGNEAQLSREDLMELVRSHPAYDELLGDLNPQRFNLRLEPGHKVVMTYFENKAEERTRKAREKAKRVKKEKELKEEARNT